MTDFNLTNNVHYLSNEVILSFPVAGNVVNDPKVNEVKNEIQLKRDKYILIECRHGLANRLRVLAAYLYLIEHKYKTSYIVMVWDLNRPCVGHFLEAFQPVPNVIFITGDLRQSFEDRAFLSFK